MEIDALNKYWKMLIEQDWVGTLQLQLDLNVKAKKDD